MYEVTWPKSLRVTFSVVILLKSYSIVTSIVLVLEARIPAVDTTTFPSESGVNSFPPTEILEIETSQLSLSTNKSFIDNLAWGIFNGFSTVNLYIAVALSPSSEYVGVAVNFLSKNTTSLTSNSPSALSSPYLSPFELVIVTVFKTSFSNCVIKE